MRYNVDDLSVVSRMLRPAATEDGKPQALPRTWEYGSDKAEAAGFRGALDYPDLLPDQKDWKEIIAECHADKRFPMYWRRDSALPKKPNQNGLGHCWNYGITHSAEDRSLIQFGMDKAKILAGNSLAWLVNWKNKGYYLNETVAGAMSRGIASREYCPEYELNPRNFKAGWEDDALNHRVAADGAWDTTWREGKTKFIAQCLAILKTGTPLYIAHNWWGHALEVTGLLWDESVANNLVWVHFNSHADGEIELTGDRGVPDEAYGIGAMTLPQAA